MITVVTAWIAAHPAIVAFVAMGVFNWIYKPRTPEQYAAMNPYVAKALIAVATMFPDPQKLIKVLTSNAKDS